MEIKIENSWKNVLNDEFEKDYFKYLLNFVKNEYASQIIYPKEKFIFNAFNECSFNNVKVVIIGQDPYHGEGQANGLCFSVNEGVKHPPSLKNIFKEMSSNVGKTIPKSGDLSYLAKQGVLLLNATLTVRAKSPGSHQNKGWEQFTDAVITQISNQKENIVFLLWGSYAQKKGEIIDRSKHFVLESPHPSPFSVHRGFFGNQHFSKTNVFLKQKRLVEIDW